ncbi:MAG: exopolysaccharide biosynthesis polyprenyl glycosylphosphotransferase [Verrucomicrobiota bacterium]
MNTNGFLYKHWVQVTIQLVTDAILFIIAFALAMEVRFGEDAPAALSSFFPFVFLGAAVLAATLYIAGFYSNREGNIEFFKRAVAIAGCLGMGIGVIVAGAYLATAVPLGRGVGLIGAVASYVLLLVHHWLLLRKLRSTSERVAYVVSSAADEAETKLFRSFGGHHLEFAGMILHNGYVPKSDHPVLGTTKNIAEIVEAQKIDRVLCTTGSLKDVALSKLFCLLRYSGVTVLPLISLCEEVDQFVPLELVSSEWLVNASGEPHMLYIRKMKRLFDILASAALLISTIPLLLLAIVAVKLTSPGPIFYRQVRSGRFGKLFTIFKLRTMCVDAEKNGAVWWGGANDPRVTAVGKWMRQYRIDELPQLLNVFRGDMSFVGPRPERPEIIEDIARKLPFYQERQMVQPGITGWAQVNYPYGASVEDAARKLEYDLYYLKHMSVFLDVFILLDTVRIVLRGGVQDDPSRRTLRTAAVLEWERLKDEPAEDGISLPSVN